MLLAHAIDVSARDPRVAAASPSAVAPAPRSRAGAAATAELRAGAAAALAAIALHARAAQRLAVTIAPPPAALAPPAAPPPACATARTAAATAIDVLREVAVQALEQARGQVAQLPRASGRHCGDELHDALGHALSLASLLAGAARARLAADPHGTAALLGELAETAAAARAELTAADEPADLPEADPQELRALAIGQPVVFDLDDALLAALPQKVAAAVHGIVREALTNARVHVPGAPVRVRLVAAPNGDSALLTIVSEPADGPRRPGSGRGLAGMRRRAQSVGGSFDAGNAVGGAFRVAARLPR